jgi:hypothetical protein
MHIYPVFTFTTCIQDTLHVVSNCALRPRAFRTACLHGHDQNYPYLVCIYNFFEILKSITINKHKYSVGWGNQNYANLSCKYCTFKTCINKTS